MRGFFAGLKKKGVAVAVLERVRQVGPNKAGAKGSYSIYRHRGRRRRRTRQGGPAEGGGVPVGTGGPRLAVGLYRVSTAEQGQSGLGPGGAAGGVRAFVAAQGWTLVAEFEDVASGKDDRRPGFRAALARCRQLGAVLVAARLDRITRRAHTLSQLLEEGVSIRAADMPGADDLMMRIYAAMAQKERELIGERTRAALAAAKARGRCWAATGATGPAPARTPALAAAGAPGGGRAGGAPAGAGGGAATRGGRRRQAAMARALTARGVPTPSGGGAWTHTTVARVMARAAA